MKKIPFLLLLLITATGLFASPYAVWDGETIPPEPQWVNDYAGILNENEEYEIAALAEEILTETTCQIVVVTVQNLGGRTIEEYALALARSWEVGWSDADNGVLIVAAMDERRLRIEVGYGLEGIVTDLVAGRIIDNIMTPAFKEGRFYDGFFEAEMAVFSLLTDDEVVREEYESVLAGNKNPVTSSSEINPLFMSLLVLGALVLFVLSLIFTFMFFWSNLGKKDEKKEKFFMHGTKGFLINYGISVLFWLCLFLSAFGLQGWMKALINSIFIFPFIQMAGFFLLASAFMGQWSSTCGSRSGSTVWRSGGYSSGYRSSGGFRSSGGGFSSGGFSGGGGSFGGGGASGGW